MDQITRRVKNSEGVFEETTFTIYTKEEAEEEGIDYKEDWRDCRPGDWGLSDDKYVIQCRGFKEIIAKRKNRSGKRVTKNHLLRRFYKFSVGEPIVGINTRTGNIEKPTFRYKEFKEKGGYSNPRARPWHETEIRKTRAKEAIELYTHLFIQRKGKLTYDDWGVLGAKYRPDDNYNVINFKSLLKTTSGQRAFMSELKSALSEGGITYQSIIEEMDETYQLARDHVHTQVMRGLLKDKLEMLEKADGISGGDEGTEFDFTLLQQQMDSTAVPGLEIADFDILDKAEVNNSD
jgi:hypothetical protein